MIPKTLTWALGLASNQANGVTIELQNEERAEGEKAKPSVVTLKRQSQVRNLKQVKGDSFISLQQQVRGIFNQFIFT